MVDLAASMGGIFNQKTGSLISFFSLFLIGLMITTIIIGVVGYWLYRFFKHKTQVIIIKKEGGASIIRNDRGQLKINSKTREVSFTLFWRNIELPNIDDTLDFIGGRLFLSQYGAAQYGPIRLVSNSPVVFLPHLSEDINWYKTKLRREIEKTMKLNWLQQNWPQLAGLTIIVLILLTLIVFFQQIGKLENLGPSIVEASKNIHGGLVQTAVPQGGG